MRAHDSRLHEADVIEVFESQDDADEAVYELRLAGYKDDRIGYFAQHPTRGLEDIMDHDLGLPYTILGSIMGALLGIGAARLLNDAFANSVGASDFLGLAITLAVFGALFIGFIGWGIGEGIHRRAVDTPAIDPAVGPFVVAVVSGGTPELARSIMYRHGGHDLPPGAMVVRPAMV